MPRRNGSRWIIVIDEPHNRNAEKRACQALGVKIAKREK
jgi:hypothetical protein